MVMGWTRRRVFGGVVAGVSAVGLGVARGQSAVPLPRRLAASSPLFTKNTIEAVLSGLNPPAIANQITPGNDLLLDIPDVALPGLVKVRLLSAMGKTEEFWLLSSVPDPATGSALLASFGFDNDAIPEVKFPIRVEKTQILMFLARVGGRYYGVQREIKVGRISRGGKP